MAILPPDQILFTVLSGSELFGRDMFFGTARRADHPNVLGMFGIKVPSLVHAIDGSRNHAHIAFAIRVVAALRGIGLRRCALGLFRRALLFAGSLLLLVRFAFARFRQIVRIGSAGERDPLAVGRPHWRTRATRQRGDLPRLAATEVQHVELRWLRTRA